MTDAGDAPSPPLIVTDSSDPVQLTVTEYSVSPSSKQGGVEAETLVTPQLSHVGASPLNPLPISPQSSSASEKVMLYSVSDDGYVKVCEPLASAAVTDAGEPAPPADIVTDSSAPSQLTVTVYVEPSIHVGAPAVMLVKSQVGGGPAVQNRSILTSISGSPLILTTTARKT